ncbi:MAG: hypothetical protein ACFFAS_15140 [Promethearchaeota archaeon]
MLKKITIQYEWKYRTATFTDNDNDGIYKVYLPSFPSGSYMITIFVDTGDEINYDFDPVQFNIVIEAKPIKAEDNTVLITVLAISIASAITLGSYAILYQKHFKIPKETKKLRKFRKSLKKPSKQLKEKDKVEEEKSILKKRD